MRLEVFVPNHKEVSTTNYLLHILDKDTRQHIFSLNRSFEVRYAPGYEEHIAQVFFRLMMQCQQEQLRFQSGAHWFVLHSDGRFEKSDSVSESLIHILLHAAFVLYDRQPV